MNLKKTKAGAKKHSELCECRKWIIWFTIEGQLVSIGSGEWIDEPTGDGRIKHKGNAIRCSDCGAEYELEE